MQSLSGNAVRLTRFSIVITFTGPHMSTLYRIADYFPHFGILALCVLVAFNPF